jgi:hypothetical protein
MKKHVLGFVNVVMKHYRLIEAAGMFLVLLAWALSWISLERWTGARNSHTQYIQMVSQAHDHGGITANVRLEAAVIRDFVNRNVKPANASGWELYAEAWPSSDVRQAWMFRASHNIGGLQLLADNMVDLNSTYTLGEQEELRQLRASILQVLKRLDLAVTPARLGNGRPPAPAIEKLSADEADKTELELSIIAERAFRIAEVLLNKIEDRRTSTSRLYTQIFIVGSMFLIAAKVINWRNDLKPPRQA